MIRKITTPTTAFPCSTKLPMAPITEPAEPPLLRMLLVVDTLIPIRYKVVIRSSDGKMENSSASLIFILISRMINPTDIFRIIITSRKNGLIGMIKSSTIMTTINDTALFNIFLIFVIFYTIFWFLYTSFLFKRKISTSISATIP